MTDPAAKPATYDDLLGVPDSLIAEVVDGELYTNPRPASRHSRVASNLGGKLIPPFDDGTGGPGGWWILFEPELHLGPDILVPDLAGWRRERMPVFPDIPFFELAPDWVCEVVSPSTGRLDRVRKLPAYARNQISHLWLIDPILRILEVYQLEEQRLFLLATHGDDEMVRAAPFDAIEIDLFVLWGEIRPRKNAEPGQ